MNFSYFWIYYTLHCSIVKNLLPVVKNQNGAYIQDGVENVYTFHTIFIKIILFCIFFFLFIKGKNKTSMENFLLENSKGRNNLILKMIFFKKIQDKNSQPLNEI
jgi:hypothetical protein